MNRLKRVKLSNFGSHEDTEIEFDHVSLFRGPHGGGKTLIASAVSFVLTGVARGLQKKNQAPALARDGVTDPGSVELEFEDGTRTTRRTTGAGKKSQIIDEAVASVLCDPMSLVTMKPEDRASLIAKSNVGAGTLQRAFDHCEITDVPNSIAGMPAGSIDKAEREAIAQRQQCGAAANALRKPKPQAGTVDVEGGEPIAIESLNSTEIDEQLAAVRAKCKKLSGEIIGGRDVNRDAVSAKREAAEKEIAEIKSRNLENEAKLAAKSKADLEIEEKGIHDKLGRVRANRDTTEKHLKALAQAGANCPLCRSDLSSEFKSRVSADFRKSITDDTAEIQKLESKLSALAPKLNKARDRLAEIAAARNNGTRRVAELTETIAECDRSLEKADLWSAKSGDLASLEARVTRGESIYSAVVAHETAMKNWEADQKQLKRHEDDREKFDTIAKALGKDGAVRREAARIASGGFTADLSLCDAFGVDAVLEAGGGFTVNGRPIGLTSGAEQYIASIAVAAGIARLSGAGFVFADEAQALVKPDRQKLVAWAMSQDDLQTIIIAASADGDPVPSKIPGLAYYEIDGGRIVRRAA